MYAGLDVSLITSNSQQIPTIAQREDKAALREKTDQFEAIIVRMMLDNALKDEKNIFTNKNDPGDRIYKSMFRDELSRAGAGSFGFSQLLFEYLSEKEAKS